MASFLSPCVLPLVPSYLSYISGLSLEDTQTGRASASGMVLFSILKFILGFSLVFILMGASASLVGEFLAQYKQLLARISGVFIIFMGLFLIGVIKIPWLYSEKRPFILRTSKESTPFLLGLAFAFGWTPCIGPILSSILLYASVVTTVTKGTILLAIYSLGLGVPFLLAGWAFHRTVKATNWIKRHYTAINAVSGAMLILLGGLLVFNQLFYLSIAIQRLFYRLGIGFLATI